MGEHFECEKFKLEKYVSEIIWKRPERMVNLHVNLRVHIFYI